jgi:hypothetical protein
VPLAIVSKTMRHKTLATRVDIYGHLTRQAAQDGVDATSAALDAADRRSPTCALLAPCSAASTRRPHHAKMTPADMHLRAYPLVRMVGLTGFEPATP